MVQVERIALENIEPQWRPIKDAPTTVPVLVGRVGAKLMALAWFHGQCWRHADSLQPVCFEPTHFQYLPDPPSF